MTRRFFIPEVVQTSAMDCGPATLKALFGGFNLYLSYGRLREACQTDVDGTSIDTLETLSAQLGLDTAQTMLPADLTLLTQSACLPAIVVTRLADGGTHFVVLWRVYGPWVQLMDPAAGRVWMTRRRFLDSLYIHEQAVPVSAWQEWSQSAQFTAGLTERLRALGLAPDLWEDRAHQDAALRLGAALRAAGRLRAGAEARRFMHVCAVDRGAIPPQYRTVRPHEDDPDLLIMRGAVLLSAAAAAAEDFSDAAVPADLPASLARVRSEKEPDAWAAVFLVLRESGWLVPSLLTLSLLAAAVGTVLEAMLFRGLFDLGRHLESTAERLVAIGSLLVFLGAILAMNWPTELALCRIGRQLELGLRMRFLSKVPRLNDRYFQSRLVSDMAFRAHWLQILRQLPALAGLCFNLLATILITGIAIALVYPGSGWLVSIAILAACGVPLLLLPSMGERDLRFRESRAALGTFYLDALLGSRAIQAHGAQSTMRATQATQLKTWAEAGLRLQALFARTEMVQLAVTQGCIIALVYSQAAAAKGPAGLLLLVYWAISIPALGQDVAVVARSLPAMRNTLLRFLELISSPEEDPGSPRARGERRGVAIDIEEASVVVAGHAVLRDVNLHVSPGEHIGIVGVSGAGKSSLVGCLLGWYEPGGGSLTIDGAPLTAETRAQLRAETAWIDPQVHLFRASLYDNLQYGNETARAMPIAAAVEAADLETLLQRAADGLQMPIGEGGTAVSGGEGQRIRVARALGRGGVRLAILDEAGRGLGREKRRLLLQNARRHFAEATLLCVTHDVSDTLAFDRVLVIEQGRIVEQGRPRELCEARSRYRQLLDEETAVARDLWGHDKWRRLTMQGGRITESAQALP
jgi:ABC-type bacteriocin/lantibiotic exporter with double-glycine peptidase domain